MKIMKNDEAVSPVIGVILMVAITVILAAVIAAFVFGLAGTTSTNKNVAFTVSLDKNNYGVATAQGGSDIARLKFVTYTIDGADPSGATPDAGTGYWFDSTGAAPSTDPPKWNVGTIYNTSAEVKGKRLILVGHFDDGTSQVLWDRTL
jgi:flagellin-like protein